MFCTLSSPRTDISSPCSSRNLYKRPGREIFDFAPCYRPEANRAVLIKRNPGHSESCTHRFVLHNGSRGSGGCTAYHAGYLYCGRAGYADTGHAPVLLRKLFLLRCVRSTHNFPAHQPVLRSPAVLRLVGPLRSVQRDAHRLIRSAYSWPWPVRFRRSVSICFIFNDASL